MNNKIKLKTEKPTKYLLKNVMLNDCLYHLKHLFGVSFSMGGTLLVSLVYELGPSILGGIITDH